MSRSASARRRRCDWFCRGSLPYSNGIAVLVQFAPVGLVAALAAEAVGRPNLVGAGPRPGLAADDAEVVSLAAQPGKHVGNVARLVVAAIIRALEVELRLGDPVPLRGRGAPVIVLEHVAPALGGGEAAAMEDTLVVDADRAGGTLGEQPALVVGALRGRYVGTGHQFGRPQFNRRILGEVEDLDEVELGAKDMVGVVMPTLGRHGALDIVMAGQYGQAEVAAQQRAHDADHLWIEQHMLNEPVFEEDGARLVGGADPFEVGLAHAVGDVAWVGRVSCLPDSRRRDG